MVGDKGMVPSFVLPSKFAVTHLFYAQKVSVTTFPTHVAQSSPNGNKWQFQNGTQFSIHLMPIYHQTAFSNPFLEFSTNLRSTEGPLMPCRGNTHSGRLDQRCCCQPETVFIFGGRFQRKRKTSKNGNRSGRMSSPSSFHKGGDFLEIGAEIPFHQEDQNESFAGNVPDPEIAGHVIIPRQRRHQRIYEGQLLSPVAKTYAYCFEDRYFISD